MKKLIYIFILVLTLPLFLTSCLKEDNVSAPVVTGTEMYMSDMQGKDSLITEIFRGRKIKIVVYTDANMVAIWPGSIRTIMKKKDGVTDSIDMFNNPVLVVSDYYSDYGLVKAKGLTTTVKKGGWYAFYTYPSEGGFNLTVVATNHGYDGPDLKRTIYEAGTVSVK